MKIIIDALFRDISFTEQASGVAFSIVVCPEDHACLSAIGQLRCGNNQPMTLFVGLFPPSSDCTGDQQCEASRDGPNGPLNRLTDQSFFYFSPSNSVVSNKPTQANPT